MVRIYLKKFTKGEQVLIMGGSDDHRTYSVWENGVILNSYNEKEKAEALFTARVRFIRNARS